MRLFAFLLMSGPATAGLYQLPAGCEGIVTIQSIDCTVAHYYRCETPDGGDIHRADMGEDGLEFFSRTDSEARWIESMNISGGYMERLQDEADPASFSGLMRDGVDTWNFTTQSQSGVIERFIGFDRLTGEEVEVDGVRLKQTQFDIQVQNSEGDVLWRSQGNEYVVPEWNIFIGGRSLITTDEDEYRRDGSPVQFDFPGDSGYLSTKPIYGCSVNLAALRYSPA